MVLRINQAPTEPQVDNERKEVIETLAFLLFNMSLPIPYKRGI